MLAPLVRVGVSCWDETHIQPGQDRQQEIAAAVAGAGVAILLVSADFLDSEFLGQELAKMLAVARRDQRLRILWVAVRACLWQETDLAAYEPVHDVGKPLSTLADADLALAEICTRIKDAVAPIPASGGDRSVPNPYQGLSAFDVAASPFFFGRQELTQKLCARFEALFDSPGATRLLAILGPSGSGKSSVARAGLLAALTRASVAGAQPLRTAILKPGARPLESLARALVPLLPPATQVLPASQALAIEQLLRSAAEPTQGLRRFADELPQIAQCPLVLLVDQFEEVYTLCTDPAERDALVGLLLHAASEPSRHLAVILTLRSDFLGETQRYHGPLNRLIAAQAVIVPAMSPDELRETITRPAEQAGFQIDANTTELLLRDVQGSEGALPLLEFALTRIFTGLTQGCPAAETLRRLGGVGGALAGEAQASYRALSDREQTIARRALSRLVHLGEGTRDTRRRVPIAELCGRSDSETDVLAVLRRFATPESRLVTLSGDADRPIAEVTHESLFDAWQDFRRWIDERRADRRFHDRVAEAARLWSEAGRPAGRLWRPPDLDILRGYHRRMPDELNAQQAEFLRASEAALQTERRLRTLLTGAGLALMLLMIAGLAFGVQQQRQRVREVTAKEAAVRGEKVRAQESQENYRQQLLSTYVEQGRQELLAGHSLDALLWLQRAYANQSNHPMLLYLLKQAMRLVDATQTVFFDSSRHLRYAIFSPDSRRIAILREYGKVEIWDAGFKQTLLTLDERTDYVESVSFSSDGNYLVAAQQGNTARIWDAVSGKPLLYLRGHTQRVYSASFSPDGKRVVTAGDDKIARIWDAASGRLLLQLKGHLYSIKTAGFSPDGQRVLTASADNTARLWDAASGKLLLQLKGHTGPIESASFSPDGRRIATASSDRTARLWDAATGEQLRELKGHTNFVYSADFSPDGHRIVTASYDKTARIWDADSGEPIDVLEGHADSVFGASFSRDGRRILTASSDGSIRIWNADTAKTGLVLRGHTNHVVGANFSPDGKRIVTASWDGTARLWDASSGTSLAELKGHRGQINRASFSADGRRIITAGDDGTARIWDADSGKFVDMLNGVTFSFKNQTGRYSMKDARFSPDGRSIVTADYDGSVRIWQLGTSHPLAVLTSTLTSHFASFSPDGKQIVARMDGNSLRIWDAQTGKPVRDLQGHTEQINSASFSPKGERIVTTSHDNTARIWDTASGKPLLDLRGHRRWVMDASFSPDGRRIVTASWDQTARIWDAVSGKAVSILDGHHAYVHSASFSPDGRRVVTTSEEDTARVWTVSPEQRSAEELGAWLRCKSLFKLEGDVIVPAVPDPAACPETGSAGSFR